MNKRIRYMVSYVKKARSWQLTSKGLHASIHATQREAVQVGAARGRQHAKDGQLAELKIKGRDGRILKGSAGCRTYGKDPRGEG